jgi:hypothetical protein
LFSPCKGHDIPRLLPTGQRWGTGLKGMCQVFGMMEIYNLKSTSSRSETLRILDLRVSE